MTFDTGSSCYCNSNHTDICKGSSPPPKNRKHVLFTFCDLYQNFEKWCHYRNTETRTSKQFSVFLKTCVVLFLTRNQMHHVTCDFLFLSVSRRSSDFTVVCAHKFAMCYLSDNTFLSIRWRIMKNHCLTQINSMIKSNI